MQGTSGVRPLTTLYHSPLSYGSSPVDLMLNKFSAFSPLRRSYFILYQSIMPNCQRCLAILRDQCDIPDYAESHIVAGGNSRTCSQRLFNFLLIKFEKDRDYNEFCDLIKMLMDFVYLRANVDKLREELAHSPYTSQGKLLLWLPPPVRVAHDKVCFEQTDDAVAVQAVGCTSEEVLMLVMPYCCLQALASPHYKDQQRRRSKAPLSIVEPTIDEIKEKLNLPILATTTTTITTTATTNATVAGVGKEEVAIITSPELAKSPSIESVLEEFPPLKILYPVLVQSLPQNFTENVGHLEQYLTATAIFGIVSSSDADQGNRMIMDCLVKQLTHQEDLLEMCDRLEKIPDAPALTHAIEELRKEAIMYIHSDSKGTASLGTPLTSLNDLSGMKVAGASEDIFNVAYALQPNTTGSEVLKKYYHRLYQSFPSDHMITLGKLVQLGNVNDDTIDWVSMAPTTIIGNQRVLDFVILMMKGEDSLLEFCDILEKLIEHPALLKLVESLRNDLIEVLQNAKTKSSASSSPSSSVDLLSGESEGMTNPMESSGVDQLLARVLSSTGTVNKTISPPSANRFIPTPTTIEEVPGDEESKIDKKAGGDDVPLGEPVDDTHTSSVATADNVVQAEECVDDSRQEQLLPLTASLSEVASPVPDHSPVPVTSPAHSPSHSPAHSPPPSPPPSITPAATTVGPNEAVTSVAAVQGDKGAMPDDKTEATPVATSAVPDAVAATTTVTTAQDDVTVLASSSSSIEDMLINQLETVMQEAPGLTVIKKHYLKLCSCLPPNYKKTIQKLRNLTDLSEEDVILILNLTEGQPTDPVAVNQRIVMHLLMNCQSHSDLLTVCSVLEELVEPLEQMRVHEFHRELTDCFKRDREEEKRRKEKEQDISMVMTHQGSVDAGEQSAQSSNGVDNDVTTAITTTTATDATPAVTISTTTPAGSSVPSEAGATASVGDNPTPQDDDTVLASNTIAMEEMIIKQLETAIKGVPGLPVIKKHYMKLCSCLPPNYKKTIQKLRNLTDLSEEDVILILNLTEGQPTDPVAINQRIVMHLLMNCQSHSDLLTVCSVLEELVEPLEQKNVHDLHRELTRHMEEERQKQKEKEQDIDMAVSHQGSVNAGEQSPQSSNGVDNDVTTTITTTTATDATPAVTISTTIPAGSSVPSEAGATASVGDNPTPQEIDYGGSDLVKQLLTENEELAVLNSNYVDLLQSFPEEFDHTLGVLLDHFTDEQATFILDSPTALVGNQKMMNILIGQLTQKMDIIPLCDSLDRIGDATLSKAVEKLRNDLLMSLEAPAPPPTTHTNDNGTNVVVVTGPAVPEQTDPSEVVVKKPTPLPTGDVLDTLSLTGEYMSILKKYYSSLLNCFPDKLSGTLEVLGTQLDDIPDELVDRMRAAPSVAEANKLLLDYLLSRLRDGQTVFAFSEMLDHFAANISEKQEIVEAFRHDVVKVLVDSGEDTNQSVSFIRLSSYLIQEGSDMPSIIDSAPQGATATPNPKPIDSEVGFPDIPFRLQPDDEEYVLESSNTPAKPTVKPIKDIPKNMPDAKKAALKTFDKYCAVMQNYVDPKVMNRLFVKQGVFSGGESPITGHAEELQLRVQMNYMLDNIRKNIGAKNAEVFYGLIYAFQTVPEYHIFANHLEVDFRERCHVPSTLTAKESLEELEEIMKYSFERSQKGFKYLPPPPAFPPYCVHRPAIMKQLVDAVLNQKFDPNCTTVCATVYGDEGCGKSTLMNELCHQRDIQKHFKDGFLFIQLGANPDTCTKLSQLYHLLTNKELKAKEDTGNMDIVISELRHVTGFYFRYLLVIIEDIWDITDIEPYLSAFSNCKVVATTQDSSIITDIPSLEYIEVSRMERGEAFSMLYKGIVDISIQLPRESARCLERLVDDLRLWPLYLYLVRGQIIHHVKFQKMQFAEALEMVTRKLSNCGLGIYVDDKQRRDRKHAEKPCIECTTQMLEDTERNRLLSTVFYAGAGCPLAKPVVERIWEISEVNACKLFTKLENSSIFICSDIYTAPSNVKKTCIQVHPVLARHILHNTDPLKVIQLWPLKTLMLPLIQDELQLSFPQYSEGDQADVEEYLKQICKRIDHNWLAENVMYLTRSAFYDPHFIMYQLKCLQLRIRNRSDLVPDDTVQFISNECLKILHELPSKLSRFNRKVDRLLYENDHDGLIELITQTCTDNSVAKAAEKCLRLFESVSEFCHNVILQWINDTMEQLKLLLSEYSENALLILPQAKLYIELRKDITVALVTDTRKWKKLSDYVKTELKECLAAIERQCKVKTQEISLKHIHQKLMH